MDGASHTEKSKGGASEKQSIGKHQSQQESGSDGGDGGDVDGDGKEESVDEIADLPSQNEMRREMILAIEEELREQHSLKMQNEELQK